MSTTKQKKEVLLKRELSDEALEVLEEARATSESEYVDLE